MADADRRTARRHQALCRRDRDRRPVARAARRRGLLPAGRERRRQVDGDQDPDRRRDADPRRSAGGRRARPFLQPARRARKRHRHRLSGSRHAAADERGAQFRPRRRTAEGHAACSADSTSREPRGSHCRACTTSASAASPTASSSSARCRAANVRRSRSAARCISARACWCLTSRPRRSACANPPPS